MIHYLVLRPNAHTIRTYLETWRRELLGRVAIEFYEDLPYRRTALRGTYIFTDIERLSDGQRAMAQSLCEQLKEAHCHVLNEPAKVLRRFELLGTLHERGSNAFVARRISDDRSNMRYPVFVREANEHTGSLTPLLHHSGQLQQAIHDLLLKGVNEAGLIIVEYCHTADAYGVFRKYSVMRIGERLVPRHVLFSNEWVDKTPDVVDVAKVAEEVVYQKMNPHERELREVFDLAHVDYGRIDYGMLDGKIQVWEINTNPVVMVSPSRCDPDRLPGQARSAARMAEAFDEIDDAREGEEIGIQFTGEMLNELGVGHAQRLSAEAKRQIKRLRGSPAVRKLVHSLRAL